MTKGLTTMSVDLGGTRYPLKFDIDSMMEIETLIQTLGLGQARGDFFKLLDPPYNIREIVIMIQSGIDGKRRYDAGDGPFKPISTDEVKKMVQGHFDLIKGKTHSIQEWRDEQGKLMDSISMAARQGAGLVVQDEPEESPNPESEFPGVTIRPSRQASK
jgi:hypothetical protein